MKITAAVLTYRPKTNLRLADLELACESLSEADEVFVADNGSDDGSVELIKKDWPVVTHSHRIHTSGFGTNFAARHAVATKADLVLVFDDDMYIRPGWREKLELWWRCAPLDLILTGCHLEPLFHWNRPYGVVSYGGLRGLLRESTGAASWSFRAQDWARIGPIPSRVQGWGDVPACSAIREDGYQIAQVDLAEHRGHGRSTWGNGTVAKFGWDLGPVRAMLDEQVDA